MSADKHFNQHEGVPPALDDHKPDDMPAARTLGGIILFLLVVCTAITVVIYGAIDRKARLEATPTEQVAP